MLNILGIDHLVLRTDKRKSMIAFYTGVPWFADPIARGQCLD